MSEEEEKNRCARGAVDEGRTEGNTLTHAHSLCNAVNLSARLMVAASNPTILVPTENFMKILVDEPTYKQAKTHVVFNVITPISVKGKSGKIPVFEPIDPEDVCLPPMKHVSEKRISHYSTKQQQLKYQRQQQHPQRQ